MKILLTGGTGSFGKAFCKRNKSDEIRIYSRDELKQVQMQAEFNDDRLSFYIGDVRDSARLLDAMTGVDLVIHAAALKHVPVCEVNPYEAVKTNVLGTKNVVDCAKQLGLKKVLALSTDKAVSPINLYGATKLCAEKIVVNAGFTCVRYGNVIGSRGSVIPLFEDRIEKGLPLPITHLEMTRFWITFSEAIDFVLYVIEFMDGGDIFIPRIPAMKTIDLARAINPDCKINVVGIRPGEKLHELLTSEEDARNMYQYEGMFVVYPGKKGRFANDNNLVCPSFVYCSNGALVLTKKGFLAKY